MNDLTRSKYPSRGLIRYLGWAGVLSIKCGSEVTVQLLRKCLHFSSDTLLSLLLSVNIELVTTDELESER